MTTLHAAAQQALDALEGAHKVLGNSLRIADAIEALRAALAPQPQAQPPLPEGWEPLVITHAGQYPEEIAYGPKRMMDRLDKWLTKYFADLAQAQPDPQLCKFYQVSTWAELVAAQEHHILRLQSKLPKMQDEELPATEFKENGHGLGSTLGEQSRGAFEQREGRALVGSAIPESQIGHGGRGVKAPQPQAQPEQAKPKAKLFLPQGDTRTARVVWSELKEGVLELCITVSEPPIAQPAVSADAYDGAREDLAIWKKRALEAESINRKFIAEVNGLTHMGEPPIAQPAKPQNCGTSYCSCIECVMEPAQAEKSCATCKHNTPSVPERCFYCAHNAADKWEPK